MKLLDRYIIRELMPPFFYSLAVIIFVLVLDFILKILNFIIAKGVPIIVVGKLFTFSLAPLMALAVPMASLMASLMAFGRLSEDKEIVALNALGVPFWRIMYPGLVFMILLSGVMLMFNISVVPEANFAVKKIFYQIHRKKPMA
ncbi:MAG TPA: LptF/LptG family permease, partial [candidate division Zixibacteria bacterium]|nr:LptF/LptG family permease [candidate division Zixibacteria bacterium]